MLKNQSIKLGNILKFHHMAFLFNIWFNRYIKMKIVSIDFPILFSTAEALS